MIEIALIQNHSSILVAYSLRRWKIYPTVNKSYPKQTQWDQFIEIAIPSLNNKEEIHLSLGLNKLTRQRQLKRCISLFQVEYARQRTTKQYSVVVMNLNTICRCPCTSICSCACHVNIEDLTCGPLFKKCYLNSKNRSAMHPSQWPTLAHIEVHLPRIGLFCLNIFYTEF